METYTQTRQMRKKKGESYQTGFNQFGGWPRTLTTLLASTPSLLPSYGTPALRYDGSGWKKKQTEMKNENWNIYSISYICCHRASL